MRSTSALLLVSAFALAACGSNLNPVNWFGGSRSEPVQVTASTTNPLIPEKSSIFSRGAAQDVYPGTPIETVSSLVVDRVPGGAIIRAEGIPAVLGVYDVRLTPATADEEAQEGVLTYRLEGIRPAGARPAGTAETRRVIAARQVTDRMLQGARSIRVEGLENAQVSRR